MAAMLKDGRHLEFFIGTRTFLKRVRRICRNQMLVSQFERFLYSWSVVCWTISHFVSYNGVIYCLSGASIHQSTVN